MTLFPFYFLDLEELKSGEWSVMDWERTADTGKPELSSDSIKVCYFSAFAFLRCIRESTWFCKFSLPDAFLFVP